MGYRGRDLNLSTAEHLRGGAGTGRFTVDGLYNTGGGDEARGGGVLLVDDAVLSCCNHAYDLALAHRSPEVGLQHLLNAMTRIDAAARRYWWRSASMPVACAMTRQASLRPTKQ